MEVSPVQLVSIVSAGVAVWFSFNRAAITKREYQENKREQATEIQAWRTGIERDIQELRKEHERLDGRDTRIFSRLDALESHMSTMKTDVAVIKRVLENGKHHKGEEK